MFDNDNKNDTTLTDTKSTKLDAKRSKREDVKQFVYKPEKYDGPIAIDCKPSKECDEYHKNSVVQINL